MITIAYNGTNQKVVDALAAANTLLGNAAFFDHIRAHDNFDLADCTPAQVAGLMQNAVFSMTIVLYTPVTIFSRTNAFDDEANPFIIHLNKLHLNDRHPLAILAATMIHECVHSADATSEYSFGHGGNSNVGKDNTAPYWINQLATRLLATGADDPALSMAITHVPLAAAIAAANASEHLPLDETA